MNNNNKETDGAQSSRETFTVTEVSDGVNKFLKYAGYQLQPSEYIGFVRPQIHTKKESGANTYQLICVVRQGMDEAINGFTDLMAIKAVIGDSADYILVLPPVSEYLMIEFLTEERGQWFFEIKQQEFMIWLCNPDRETTTCLIGSPRDKPLNQYFAAGSVMSFDMYINMKLSQLIWDEE